MSSPNNQKTIFNLNSNTDSPLRSLTGMVMDKLNFNLENLCSSYYVERQLEFEMQQSDGVITAHYDGYVELQQPKLFDEASVVESVTSRASLEHTPMERFSV